MSWGLANEGCGYWVKQSYACYSAGPLIMTLRHFCRFLFNTFATLYLSSLSGSDLIHQQPLVDAQFDFVL